MRLYAYHTQGGKNLIEEFLDSLPRNESVLGYTILERLKKDGFDALEYLDTRQIKGKLWEIKFYRYNRIFYIAIEEKAIYLLHACKKQKDKAEQFEIETAEKRMKEILLNATNLLY